MKFILGPCPCWCVWEGGREGCGVYPQDKDVVGVRVEDGGHIDEQPSVEGGVGSRVDGVCRAPSGGVCGREMRRGVCRGGGC